MRETLGTGRQIRVLIAEDDALVADVIERELERQGYLVADRVEDGLAAFERAQVLRPDVILMDVAMPEMGGLEATRLIQQYCAMPVVLLTAHDDAWGRRGSRRCGRRGLSGQAVKRARD